MVDAEALADIISDAVATATAPLLARIAVLERRADVRAKDGTPGERGEKGDPGRDGKDADPELIREELARALLSIPAPKDGTSVTVDDVAPLIASEVAKAVAALPTPKDGVNGKDGESVSADAVHAMVKDAVAAEVAKMPLPRDGKDADPAVIRAEVIKVIGDVPMPKDGRDGKDGESIPLDVIVSMVKDAVAEEVAQIPPAKDGKDGIGVTGALISREGDLVFTFTNGETKSIGAVVGAKGDPGRDGVNGKDGADGLGFDDIDVQHDGERTFAIKFLRGERTKNAGDFTIPCVIYRGVWEEGRSYAKGDAVTWGGSQWVAKEVTTAKPGDSAPASRAWQLAVKAGRDGKQGLQGPAGPQGAKGDKGDRGPERW